MAVLLTDIDDVLVLQRTVDFNKHSPEITADIARRLLHVLAMQTLSTLVDEGVELVITSNWTRFMSRECFQRLFIAGGYPCIASALHADWQAPSVPGRSRLQAIDGWLSEHQNGQAFAVIDDIFSGSSLKGSQHDLDGRVVLCTPGVGLHPGHLPALRAALTKPATSTKPSHAGGARRG